MKKTSGKLRTQSILTFAFKAIAALAVLTVLLGFAKVNNALHPPRIVGFDFRVLAEFGSRLELIMVPLPTLQHS